MFHTYAASEQGTSSQQSNGFKLRNQSHRKSHKLYNGASGGNTGYGSMSIEDSAAIRIQTAFRGFRVYMNTFYPISPSMFLFYKYLPLDYMHSTMSFNLIWFFFQSILEHNFYLNHISIMSMQSNVICKLFDENILRTRAVVYLVLHWLFARKILGTYTGLRNSKKKIPFG